MKKKKLSEKCLIWEWEVTNPPTHPFKVKYQKYKKGCFYWPIPLGYKGIERHSHTSGPFVILTWKIFWPFLFHLFTELLTWFPIQKQIHPSFPYFSLFTCFFNCTSCTVHVILQKITLQCAQFKVYAAISADFW